jgi:hypothetical protein
MVQRQPRDVQVARARRTAGPTGTRSPGPAEAPEDVADNAARLTPTQQLVVLMLEDRWFDHMLGDVHLKGGRENVDGLRASTSNQHAGTSYQRTEERRYGSI